MPLAGLKSLNFAGGFLSGGTFTNASGSGQGNTVTVACSFNDQFGNGRLPSTYVVSVAASQACFHSISNKSATGFTVTLTPISSTSTLASGTIDVVVVA